MAKCVECGAEIGKAVICSNCRKVQPKREPTVGEQFYLDKIGLGKKK